jgi:hypothetical protein
MTFARWSISMVAAVGVLAATIAGASIWLLLTNPVTAVNAVTSASQGDVAPLMQALGSVLYEALQGLFKYL